MDSYQGLMRGQVPGIRPRSAGIAGRGGPGGGSLDTGVVARNQPFTGTLRSNTAPSFLGSQIPTSPQSFLAGATKGLKSLGINNLLKSLKGIGKATGIELGLLGLDTTLRATNPTFAAKRNIADAYTAKYGPNYSLTPQEMAAKLAKTGDIDPLTMRQLYGGSGDMDAGIDSIKTAPAKLNDIAGIVDVNPKTGKGIPGTFRRGDMDAGDSATYTRQDGYVFDSDVAPPPSNNVPASSAEQTMMDPYAYNLAVYGQGRQLATTKDERAAVRDLGLAINRSLYPKLNKTQDINPLLQATFPERTNDTLTGNINSRGTTLPGSMTEADSGSELATAQLQDTPYQATFRLGMMQGQEADERMNVLNDATTLVEQLMGQAQTDEIRRRLGM
jgi:hypothetical protein